MYGFDGVGVHRLHIIDTRQRFALENLLNASKHPTGICGSGWIWKPAAEAFLP